MANVMLTHDMLANRALVELENRLTFSRHVYKGYNSEYHAVGRFKKGDTIRVELPVKYRTSAGPTMSTVSDLQETNTTVQVDVHRYVALRPGETEWTQDIEQFNAKHIVPATIALANYVDANGLEEVKNIYNMVGTAGTAPTTFATIAEAAQRMANEAVPPAPRYGVVSPKGEKDFRDGELKSLFSQPLVERLVLPAPGAMGMIGGFEWYMDQNVISVTTGTRAGTPLVNATASEGDTTLVIKGLNASETVSAGEIFTVAGVVGVNPISGVGWEGDEVRQFVVTADATASGGGVVTCSISPTIYSSLATATTVLPYQTVVDLPATDDAVTWGLTTLSTAYPQHICFHPDAFALTMVPFAKPISAGDSVRWGQASDDQMGLAITMSTQFDITNWREATRMDILFGWDTIRPELACRITG